ncbi:MAG: hypothetical protein RJB12_942 [Pseudomonadota bacterium]|jgi:hypothetical protein
MTTTTAQPAIAMELRSIDWILARLAILLVAYPARRADLIPRIDGALDERLRLMRLRDGIIPFPKHGLN